MSYKVILFDADGVTLNPPRWFSQQLETDYGISQEMTKPFFTGAFQDCMFGKADLKEELAKVIPLWGWRGSVEEIMKYWFATEDHRNQKVLDIVARMRSRGVFCYMATNQEKYRGQFLREVLKEYFEDIFVSADLGFKKHQKGFYEQVYARIKNQAEDDKSKVLFIDDEEKNVAVAKEFGFKTIHYLDFNDLEELMCL